MINFKKTLLFYILALCFLPNTIADELHLKYLVTRCAESKEKANCVTNLADITIFNDGYLNTESNKSQLYNFKDKTITYFDHNNKTNYTTSLYAPLAFRKQELYNRGNPISELAKTIPFLQFELENTFGLLFKQGSLRSLFTDSEIEGQFAFNFDNQKIAQVSFSDYELSPQLFDSYQKLITYEFNVHPYIKQKISAHKKIIKQIEFRYHSSFDKIQNINFELQSASINSTPQVSNYLMRWNNYNKLLSKYSKLDGFMRQANTNQIHFNKLRYRQAFKRYMREKNYFDAVLVLHEYLLHTGEVPRREFKKLSPYIQKGTPEFKLMEAIKSADGDVLAAYQTLVSIRAAAKERAYIVDIFIGDLFKRQGKLDEAMSFYYRALSHNPSIMGVYISVGHVLFAKGYTDGAFSCYGLLKQLAPHHPMMQSVSKLENLLQEEHPEYF
jgi:tetratricopeptide (TPR) repeat protein